MESRIIKEKKINTLFLKELFKLQEISEVDLSTPLVENYEPLNNDDEIPVEFFDFLDVSEKSEPSVQNTSSSPVVETEEKTFVRKSVIQKYQRPETEKQESVDTSIILKPKSRYILIWKKSPNNPFLDPKYDRHERRGFLLKLLNCASCKREFPLPLEREDHAKYRLVGPFSYIFRVRSFLATIVW